MAKRSNFQGGIPGSYANMMKQAQRMQAQIQQSKEQLEQQSFVRQQAVVRLRQL